MARPGRKARLLRLATGECLDSAEVTELLGALVHPCYHIAVLGGTLAVGVYIVSWEALKEGLG